MLAGYSYMGLMGFMFSLDLLFRFACCEQNLRVTGKRRSVHIFCGVAVNMWGKKSIYDFEEWAIFISVGLVALKVFRLNAILFLLHVLLNLFIWIWVWLVMLSLI